MMRRKRWGWLTAVTVGLSAGMAAMGTPLAAVQMADGTVYFERPPSLVGATTTRSDVYASRPRYYFTLDVPTDAGEPLQQISISQRTNYGVLGDVLEDLEDVEAFLGTRRDRGDAIAIRDVAVDEENQSVTVTLETPVAPGNAVTLALRPERNPRRGGVYLFGVTAFPSGEKAQGQFLGYGRLHFYERNNNPFRFNLF